MYTILSERRQATFLHFFLWKLDTNCISKILTFPLKKALPDRSEGYGILWGGDSVIPTKIFLGKKIVPLHVYSSQTFRYTVKNSKEQLLSKNTLLLTHRNTLNLNYTKRHREFWKFKDFLHRGTTVHSSVEGICCIVQYLNNKMFE
jgi:hypothetical protein